MRAWSLRNASAGNGTTAWTPARCGPCRTGRPTTSSSGGGTPGCSANYWTRGTADGVRRGGPVPAPAPGAGLAGPHRPGPAGPLADAQRLQAGGRPRLHVPDRAGPPARLRRSGALPGARPGATPADAVLLAITEPRHRRQLVPGPRGHRHAAADHPRWL